MKNIRIKTQKNCDGKTWSVGIFAGKRNIRGGPYRHKSSAIRTAKKISKLTNISYSDEIVEQHGC